jgi:hypothetical protein
LYVTAMESDIFPFNNGALHFSNDGGSTWAVLFDYGTAASHVGAGSTAPAAYVGGVALDVANPNQLWLAFEDTDGIVPYGLWHSTNGGATWEPVVALGDYVYASRLVNSPSGLYVAGTYGGLYRSTDTGVTWTTLLSGTQVVGNMTACPGTANALLMTDSFSWGTRLLDSMDSWHSIPVDTVGGPVLALENTLYVGSRAALFASTNNGISWVRTTTGMNGVTLSDVASGPTHIFAATEIGLFRAARDSATWQVLDNGLPQDFMAAAVAVDPIEPDHVYAGADHYSYSFSAYRQEGPLFYSSADNGETWSAASSGLPSIYRVRKIVVSPQGDGRRIILLGYNGDSSSVAAYQTADPEQGWSPITPLPFGWSLSVADGGFGSEATWVGGAVGQGGAFELDHDGLTATQVGSGWPGLGQAWSIAVAREPWQLLAGIYTGDTDGGIYSLDSSDSSWVPMISGAPSGLWSIPTAVFARGQSSVMLSGYSKGGTTVPLEHVGAFQWNPSSDAWNRLSHNLRGAEVTMFAEHPDCADQVFVGTTGGGLGLLYVGD